MPKITLDQRRMEFREAAKPLQDYIRKYGGFNTKALITRDSAELMYGKFGFFTETPPGLLPEEIIPKGSEMKVWDIYAEGYRCTGQSAGAQLMGQAPGRTFQEACDNLAKKDREFQENYDPKRLTHWGCHLFDNLEAARRSFG